VGLYEYKIEIYDKSGNSYIESKWVNVIDTINPIIISAPTNHTFELDNFESYSLIWTVNDLDPYIYNVYIDDILNHSYSWIKDIPIGIILFDLDIAVYNYTVESIDKSGNAVTNSVFITIVDNISPKLQLEPNDQIIQSGENAIIEWIFNDKSALNYVIYINGTQYTQDNWKDSEVILLKLNDLNIGKYNITIQCFDKQGNSSIDSVLIDVIAHKESIISFGIYFFAIMIAGFIGLVLHTKKRL